MAKFGFVEEDESFNVSIRGKSYPVIKAGKGIPCLLICLGTPSLRTISKNFVHMFEVYSSDMYWVDSGTLDDPDSITMDIIIDDIKALAEALKLKKYVIFAHSACGIIALEFAKKYPNAASAIIMIGTPLNSNQNVAETNNAIFQHKADQRRKLIDAERRAQIEKEDLSQLNTLERWLREYVYRDAPRYWHISDFDCTELWKGINLNRSLMRLFSDILPKTNVLKGLEKINEPIFLAAGMSDYDCCPWVWQEVPNLPKNFTISIFNKSGHWPHYEEADLFDESVKKWIEAIHRS
jgi:proline iminopeptidase